MSPTLLNRLKHGLGRAFQDEGPVGSTHADADSHDGGFTLIEVLVSLAIFAVVSAAALTAVAAAIRESNSTRNRTTAANIAQQDLQQVRAVADRTKVAAITAKQTRTVGTRTFSLTRAVSGTCTGSYAKGYTPASIDVATTVTWPGNTRGVTIGTRLAC